MMAFSPGGGTDEADGGSERCAHVEILGRFRTLGERSVERVGGCGTAGGDGTHVPAMAAPLRGGGRGRASRSPARQAIAEAGARGGSGTDRAALPGALPGLHGQALPRACRGGVTRGPTPICRIVAISSGRHVVGRTGANGYASRSSG